MSPQLKSFFSFIVQSIVFDFNWRNTIRNKVQTSACLLSGRTLSDISSSHSWSSNILLPILPFQPFVSPKPAVSVTVTPAVSPSNEPPSTSVLVTSCSGSASSPTTTVTQYQRSWPSSPVPTITTTSSAGAEECILSVSSSCSPGPGARLVSSASPLASPTVSPSISPSLSPNGSRSRSRKHSKHSAAEVGSYFKFPERSGSSSGLGSSGSTSRLGCAPPVPPGLRRKMTIGVMENIPVVGTEGGMSSSASLTNAAGASVGGGGGGLALFGLQNHRSASDSQCIHQVRNAWFRGPLDSPFRSCQPMSWIGRTGGS